MADTKKSSKGTTPVKKTTEKNASVESSSTTNQTTEQQTAPDGKPSKAENIISVVLGLAVVVVIGAMIFNAIKGRQEQQTTTTPAVQEASISAMHTVAAGETLWRIAEQYYQDGYKWVDIQKANNLDTGNSVEVGDVLIIPVIKIDGSNLALGPTGGTGVTETPTATPEPTVAPTNTPEPTQVPPTATPRDLNLRGLLATNTPEPTQVPPTATPRDLLSLFKNAIQSRPTTEPTQAPTNTPESTEASATVEPSQSPTDTIQATVAPTDTPEPTAQPTVEPTKKEIVRPTNTPEVEENTSSASTEKQYTVEKGDSLWTIAQKVYNDPYKWVEIARANNLKNPNVIHVGNTFIIP